MSKPLLRLGQYLLIVAMFAGCGGHWLVLQSMAWSGMIVEYSRSGGLSGAVEKTFDGKHLCGFCKAIQKSQGAEQKSEAQMIKSKLELFYSCEPRFLLPMGAVWVQSVVDFEAEARVDAPLVPPPRVA